MCGLTIPLGEGTSKRSTSSSRNPAARMAASVSRFGQHPSESRRHTANVATLAVAVARYDTVRVALVEDRLDDARAAAAELAKADSGLAPHADAVAGAADAAAARSAFAELSRALVVRLSADASAPKVLAYHCPMAAGYAYWIQSKAGIGNPYMGTSMPACGEERALKAAAKAASSG